MKNGVHSSNSNFFQHMAIFTIYFGICLFGLLIRDYYRVPSSYIIHEKHFFHMFCVTLQQVTDAYENLHRHPISAIQIIRKMWFVTYIVTTPVLLVNMFIAMMGNRYAMVNERKKEWLRQ
ncbi:unnamed protein product [Rotaria socialis]|uniref:Ion transport domain-containing protein n=1 Tax=Rotaria socialis TaxID=392032 RepID=A0A820T3H6_9BILA|nr:unnamed protein product [Rotaria socialis]CAF4459744.1 unnamed protein product [Rotaria socialis]CAF4486716.1 unnamed protein product [Rotaria socialis]CAF4498519.1 unnamed protein product [Rotaria socialis]CAF4898420.1 unnamed protein product [Rotaria socialis]